MIDIPVYNASGKQVDTVQVDEILLGGHIRATLLKQAYVRGHANRRQGTAATRNRSRVAGSTRKLYRQKGTGNARRGTIRTNIMRGGGVAFAKRPKSWRQEMPTKMRRLANRNAILAKMVDHDGKPLDNCEIKLVDTLAHDKPSTKQFMALLDALKVDRSCLVAMTDTTQPLASSARNVDSVSITRIDQLNVFDVLNHRYLLADKQAFTDYIASVTNGRDKAAPADVSAAAVSKDIEEQAEAEVAQADPKGGE